LAQILEKDLIMELLSPFLVKLFLAITVILGGGPWPVGQPEVYLVDQETMSQYRPVVCGKYPPVAYFVEGNQIILANTLRPFDNPQDASILVHELQHYIQSQRKGPQERPLRLEREAYHVQDRFLRLLGEKPTFNEDMLKC